jgi:hypothetical protein
MIGAAVTQIPPELAKDGTGHYEPTSDAGYTTAGNSPTAKPIGQFLVLGGESIYEGLGVAAHAHGLYEPNAQT